MATDMALFEQFQQFLAMQKTQHAADTVDNRRYIPASDGRCQSYKRGKRTDVISGTGREQTLVGTLMTIPVEHCRSKAIPGMQVCESHNQYGSYDEQSAREKASVVQMHLEDLDVDGLKAIAKAAGLLVMDKGQVPATATKG